MDHLPNTTTCLTLVTPEMARQFLEKTATHQRKIDMHFVSALVHDITNDRWVITHQGIAFDEDGILVDGRHRLTAIVKAQKAVHVHITTGLQKDAILAIDLGRSRSMRDMGQIMNVNLTGLHAAVLNFMLPGFGSHIRMVTTSKRLELIEKHQEPIDFAIRAIPKKKHIQIGAVLAPVARAWYTQSHTRLLEFGQTLCNLSIGNPEEDKAALTLRSWLERITEGRRDYRLVYLKTSRALKGYLDREPLARLYIPEEELFQMPTQYDSYGEVIMEKKNTKK